MSSVFPGIFLFSQHRSEWTYFMRGYSFISECLPKILFSIFFDLSHMLLKCFLWPTFQILFHREWPMCRVNFSNIFWKNNFSMNVASSFQIDLHPFIIPLTIFTCVYFPTMCVFILSVLFYDKIKNLTKWCRIPSS